MSTRDESRPVRDEDAFDVGAVAAWLREHARDQAAKLHRISAAGDQGE